MLKPSIVSSYNPASFPFQDSGPSILLGLFLARVLVLRLGDPQPDALLVCEGYGHKFRGKGMPEKGLVC